MDKDKKLRKVTKHVWDFIYFKLVLTSKRPVIKGASGVNTDMIKCLRMVIWTGTYLSLSEWRQFVYEHYTRMTSSPKLFATYVIYACYITKKFSQDVLDAYETFIRTMSLVVQLALYTSHDRQEELLDYSQDIFIEFFENELKKDFNKQGGWNDLGEYLERRNPLELFKLLEKSEEEGKSPKQIVKFLEMDSFSKPDLLMMHLSRGIKEAEVENFDATFLILKSLDNLLKAKSDRLELKDLRIKPGDPKIVFQQTKKSVQPVKRNSKRITTRETYLRAKEIIQDLRFDFQMLEELIEFVFGDTFKES